MPNATSRGFRIGFVKEVTAGITPALPLTIVRTTGGGGKVSSSAVESEELQLVETADVVRVGADGAGEINYEYSYGGHHGFLEAIMGGTFTANVLSVGTTLTPLTIEDQYTDAGVYVPYKGCLIESMSINLAQGQKITGRIGYRATVVPTAGSATSAGTGGPTAAPTDPIMSPVGSVQLIQEGGSLDLRAKGVTAFSIEMMRTSIAMPQVGSLSLNALDAGSFSAKGSFSLYVADRLLLDKYLSDTLTSLAFTIGGASTKRDAFLFSKVRLTDGGIQPVSRNGAAIQTYNWQAIFDATTTTARVTRTP